MGIGHQEDDGEKVVQVKGHGLPCVEGEVAYSSEGGNPLDHAVVVDHARPMAAPQLLGEGAELFGHGAVVLMKWEAV